MEASLKAPETLIHALLDKECLSMETWAEKIEEAKAARKLGHQLRGDAPNEWWTGRPSIWSWMK